MPEGLFYKLPVKSNVVGTGLPDGPQKLCHAPQAIFFSDLRKEYGKKSKPKEGLDKSPLLWKPPRPAPCRYRHMPGNVSADPLANHIAGIN